MKVSVSRINSMGFCPRQHHYTYNLNLEPIQPADSLSVGSLVHSGLEQFYKTGTMPVVPDDLGEVGDKARSALLGYRLMAEMHDNFQVVDVEKKFSTQLEGTDVTFTGIIDGVVRLDGQLWLLEHKSCSQHWSDERIGLSNQHVLYELAAQELYGDEVHGTIYNFLRITKRAGDFHTDVKRVFVPADQHARVEAYEDMMGKIDAIKFGFKSRNPGQQCAYCSMFKLCQSDYLGGDTQYLIDTFYKERKADVPDTD